MSDFSNCVSVNPGKEEKGEFASTSGSKEEGNEERNHLVTWNRGGGKEGGACGP